MYYQLYMDPYFYFGLYSYQGLFGLICYCGLLFVNIYINFKLLRKKNSINLKKFLNQMLSLQLIFLILVAFDTMYITVILNIIFAIIISTIYQINKLE